MSAGNQERELRREIDTLKREITNWLNKNSKTKDEESQINMKEKYQQVLVTNKDSFKDD